MRRSRKAPSRAASATRSASAARAATANDTAAATSCVPLRTWRCWPPPWISGTTVEVRLSTSAPMPTGPPILWAETLSASTPSAAKSIGRWP